MADKKPLLDFKGAFDAAGDEAAGYAQDAGRGLMGSMQSGGNELGAAQDASHVPEGEHPTFDFASAGKAAGQQTGITPGIMNFLDTMRVFFHNIPQQWQSYLLKEYDPSDARMQMIEQKLQQGFKNIQGAASGAMQPSQEGPIQDTANAMPADPSGLMRPAEPQGPSLMSGQNTAPQSQPEQQPMPPGPPPSKPTPPPVIAHNNPAREPTIHQTDPALNRLSKDATLGDAVAFLMSQSNLSRQDAFDQAQKWKAGPPDNDAA